MVKKTIEEALKDYSKDVERNFFENSEEERKDVLQCFPLESWNKMTVENYALGHEKSEESFCR